MNKEEYKKHCEEQIERCIKLRDSKHLREHELSLALLKECEDRRKREENLIKYLENKINDYKIQFSQINGDYGLLNPRIETYEDILERIKNNNYD